MSTSSNCNNPELAIPNNVFENIKLPPLLLQAFTISNNQAKCIKCNISCLPETNYILFHLTLCNGIIIKKLSTIKLNLNCLICDFKTKILLEWINHFFNDKHIFNSCNFSTNGYSYSCDCCETHFYGFKDAILQHRCKPKIMPVLSEVMAYIYTNFKFQNKHMSYYCVNCNYYSYDICDFHTNENCKTNKDLKEFKCDSCLITFYDLSESTFFNHTLSFEHLVIKILNSEKTMSTEVPKKCCQLPLYITKYFVFNEILLKAYCVVCKKIDSSSFNYIYTHYNECISTRQISNINEKLTPINIINCEKCNFFVNSAVQKNMYKCWVDHVKSPKHLITMSKKNQKLFSYYCYVNGIIFYGTYEFIRKNILQKNNEIDRSAFMPEVMYVVYQRFNTYMNNSFLNCCGFCQNYKNTCKHKVTAADQSFCCSSCLVYFNVQSDYNDHLLTSEHIILTYFKPNKESDIKFLEHSMEAMKFCANNDYISSFQETSDDKEIYTPFKTNFEFINKSDRSCFFSNTSNQETKDINNCSMFKSQSISSIPNLLFSSWDQRNEDIKNSNELKNKNIVDESYSFSLTKNNKYVKTENRQSTPVQKRNKTNNRNNVEIPSNTFSPLKKLESFVPKPNHFSNFINMLSAQSKGSALNNYHRLKLESLNNTLLYSDDFFVEFKMYYCSICNVIIDDEKNWIEHDTEFHENIKSTSVFYCTICHVYYIDYLNSISKHIKSTGHNIMFEFQKYMKNQKINSVINNTNKTPVDENKNLKINSNILNVEENEDKIYKHIYIEIEDINEKLKLNNYFLLNKLIKEKYGNFKRISNLNNFYVFFENKTQISKFVMDEKKLKKEYGFIIKLNGQHNEKVLSFKIIELLCDWQLLNNIIIHELHEINDLQHSSEKQLKILCDAVHCLKKGLNSKNIHIFGSRVYGLATKNSDVDLYIDIGDTFDGSISNNLQKQVALVNEFAYQCRLRHKEYKNVHEICDARVPIVKFFHIPTNLNCDLSFKSGLSVTNTKLIKFYLSIDESILWIVYFVVKHWAPLNNFKDNKNLFTSYALVWLVLFYLMNKNIIPSVVQLSRKASKNEKNIIEGWNCTFTELTVKGKCYNEYELLMGFFKFYSKEEKFINSVLCTYTGICMHKKMFFNNFCSLPYINKNQLEKFKTFQSKIFMQFERNKGLVIQDPFEFSFNITKNIPIVDLRDFCEMCAQSANILSKTQLFNVI